VKLISDRKNRIKEAPPHRNRRGLFDETFQGMAGVVTLTAATSMLDRRSPSQFLPQTCQNSITDRSTGRPRPHKLMPDLTVGPDMTASLAAFASSLPPLQAGLLASQAGQLLVALVAVAIIIVVGKFVLKSSRGDWSQSGSSSSPRSSCCRRRDWFKTTTTVQRFPSRNLTGTRCRVRSPRD